MRLGESRVFTSGLVRVCFVVVTIVCLCSGHGSDKLNSSHDASDARCCDPQRCAGRAAASCACCRVQAGGTSRSLSVSIF